MTGPPSNRKGKPTFLWQALLIVLPVAVLAVFGFFSLRQDRVLAQHEAAERAQAIADDLLPKIWAELTALRNPRPSQPRAVQVDRDDIEPGAVHLLQSQRHAFQVDNASNLIFPPLYSEIPAPLPLNPADLNESQAHLWAAATSYQNSTVDSSTNAYHNFIAANPPDKFAAVAWYRLGLLSAGLGRDEAAVDAFETLLVKNPGALSEAGLPLARFSELKLLHLARATPPRQSLWSPSPDIFCSNVVYQPNFLTPRLLHAAAEYSSKNEIQKWQSLWDEHESTRFLFAAARPALVGGQSNPVINSQPPRFFWFATPQPLKVSVTNQLHISNSDRTPTLEVEERDWFALRFRDEIAPAPKLVRYVYQRTISHNGMSDIEVTGPAVDLETTRWYVCRGRAEIAAELNDFASHSVHLADYFGLGLEVAGRKISIPSSDLRLWREVHYNGKASGERKEVSNDLATTILASATKTETGADLLKVNIYLTSPAMLFKRQNARTFWFGSLILLSALAALLGLLAAWRAFHRQLQLSEMKSNFVASVSHELRAPIASVRLMAESLERGKVSEPAKQNEYFRFIGQESRRLSSLIENVLDFSRIEQGRKQYEFEPTDLLALTQQTVKIMEPYAAEKQVTLKLSEDAGVQVSAPPQEQSSQQGPLSPALSPSEGERENLRPATFDLQPMLDGRALQQALVNLLDNAIKHSAKGSTVTVGLEIQNPKSRIQDPAFGDKNPDSRITPCLLLWVEDHGAGIPAEEHEKIFERFYRLGLELRRETQGVGIGLSIVKHIVEAHGGRVDVRSAPGEGSRFTIELPVQPEAKNDE